ncbi:penicillin-binding protein, partial [Mycobacterium tuberculosis]
MTDDRSAPHADSIEAVKAALDGAPPMPPPRDPLEEVTAALAAPPGKPPRGDQLGGRRRPPGPPGPPGSSGQPAGRLPQPRV